MKKYLFVLSLAAIAGMHPVSAQTKTKNLVIVTLDGMRWQEVVGGADSALLKNKKFTRDSAGTFSRFWNEDIDVRRKKLFPFLLNTIAVKGQLYGNRWKGSDVKLKKRYEDELNEYLRLGNSRYGISEW